MFIYKLDGITITISLPSLSIIYSKSIGREGPLESLSLKDRTMLSDVMKEYLIFPEVYRTDNHEWFHPPRDSRRYKEIYQPSYLGIFPLRSGSEDISDRYSTATHFHYYAPNAVNSIKSIFKFLEAIAQLQEDGCMLHFSCKDLDDLKQKYSAYWSFFTLERLSEMVGESALKTLRVSDDIAYVCWLRALRSDIEDNIGSKTYRPDELQTSIRRIKCFSSVDDSFSDIYEQGMKLTDFISNGKNGFPTEHTRLPDDFLSFSAKHPGQRITNKNIVFPLMVFFIMAAFVSLPEEDRLSVIIPSIIGLSLFGLLGLSDEEPRFFKPAVKKIVKNLIEEISQSNTNIGNSPGC